MRNKKIDLIYFSATEEPDWNLGSKIQADASVAGIIATLTKIISTDTAEWVLIWNYSISSPDAQLIQQLSTRPVDAWHAGLRIGLAGLPDVLNYVHPTWIYNKDASPEIEHSSFRLGIGACLVRTWAIKKVLPLTSAYSSIAMMGIALGYKLMKAGAVVRYRPDMLSYSSGRVTVPVEDEWIFAHEFFTKKWQIWTVMNKPDVFANLRSWLRHRAIVFQKPRANTYPSNAVSPVVQYKTVSVLAPTLNRYSYLLNELAQLSKQTILPVEVLITDQTDAHDRITVDFSQFPDLSVRYFPQDEKGQCLAWNKLIAEAKGEYVLFLGDDADDIRPDFIERLLGTMQRFDCDMVASNVIELGMPVQPINHYYYMSDTFPITLIKKSVVEKAGMFDMFYNKNIRADQDLAMRCHLNGALMIFDPSAVISHHRAPSGGLRTHNARVITNHISKNSITKFAVPASSEIYLAKKYYSKAQYRNYIRIKYFNQLIVNGNIFRKLLRGVVFAAKLPAIIRSYKTNLAAAETALTKMEGDK